MKQSYKRTKVNGTEYYGKHLLLTALNCNENIKDIEIISNFIKDLVPAIDMQAFGDLIIYRFGEGIEIGISAVQLILTSSITIHTNDAYKDMYLDVFSCKWFDEDVVKKMIKNIFNPEEIKETIILR